MGLQDASKEKIFYIILLIVLIITAILVPVVIIQCFRKERISRSDVSLTDNYLCGYFSLKKYYDYVDSLEPLHEYFLSKETIGSTIQKNEIHNFVLLHSPTPRQVITVVSGIFANDHKSILITLHLLNKLLWDCKMSRNLFRKFNVHIIPLLNPDGYNYSLSTPTSSYWIKNRSPQKQREPGVNLYYNFDKDFKKSNSTDPSLFSGTRAFSELESKAFQEYFDKYKDKIRCVVLLRGTHITQLQEQKMVTLAPSDKDGRRLGKLTIEKAVKAAPGFVFKKSKTLNESLNGRFDNWLKAKGTNIQVFTIRMDYRKVYGEDVRTALKDIGSKIVCMIMSFADTIYYKNYKKTESISC